MASKAHEQLTTALDDQHQLLASQKGRLIETLDEISDTLKLVRIKMGMSPAQVSIANIGRGTSPAKPSHSPVGVGTDEPIQTRRLTATRLMKAKGYRVADYSNMKGGLVRIVGPDFDEQFFDVADFDGTADNAV